MGAPSVHYLCKSLIIENTCFSEFSEYADKDYCRFYCIIIQYSTSYAGHKLFKFLRGLKNPPLPKKMYHFRLAEEKESIALTGYEHNAICPFGMKYEMPYVLSERISHFQDSYIWLGGGDVNLKLGIKVNQFIEICKPYVVDITHPDYIEKDFTNPIF
uniref:YbaK/aminoacyl-tRNA synthetase-associated domain-containing protein n=1 Tax=Arcella intermedia TaxID=1963864 RepID=A0A6B2LLK3_9EUKA